MKELFLSGHESFPIFVRIMDEVANPKGLVQILHDCGEHSGRYVEFANFLNQHGYIVMVADLRAHGKTADGKLGVIEDRDYFNNVVNDNIALIKYATDTYKLPIALFANAFGGQLALALTQRASEMINSCVLMSTPHISETKIYAILSFLRVQAKLIGRDKPAKLFLKMLDFANTRHMGSKSESFSWLTNDKEEIKKYCKDDYCANALTIGFFLAYFEALKQLYSPKRMSRIRKSLPIFIAAGDSDPLAEYGKSVNNLYENLADATIKNIRYKLYLNMKHDLLHDIKREEVMNDVLSFIENYIVNNI